MRTKDFIPLLKDHLIARLQGRAYDGDENEYSAEERSQLLFQHGRLYKHSVLRVNYTTYDLRRNQDIIKPASPKNMILVSSSEDPNPGEEPHPFWYAKVIGVYHANIIHAPSGNRFPRRMDFLWVRWLGRDLARLGGFKERRLDRVGYVPHPDGSFAFLDPANVIRGCHLIPAFSHGHTEELLPKSSAWDHPTDGDWRYYYVNRCVPSVISTLAHALKYIIIVVLSIAIC